MAGELLILAGHRAYERIREKGLSPDDVSMVVGASGAAKWLVLHGLESAIFGRWFEGRQKPLHLFGTSIGAWKSAAAAQADPEAAFDRLARAYIHQYYTGKVTPRQVSAEAHRIMDTCLGPGKAEEILAHPYCRLHLSTVRCRGPLASDHPLAMIAGIAGAWAANRVSRELFRAQCRPTLFFDPRDVPPFSGNGEFSGGTSPLTSENLRQALLASGSIPYIMEGVRDIPGGPKGVYRDGGLFHYHPAFDFLHGDDGLVLYPHFYGEVTLGWFDRNRPSRMAGGALLSDVVLLAPSPSFVASLPLGRIPDRRDFDRLAGKDAERVAFWETSVAMGRVLGESFLEASASGRIREMVRRIP
ncbi:patatin-like phospholipase family protein [Desulfoluna spongiiphila]|uniref:Patatin-like phospholipase n=1 Tax=Desulfoluna spongiiphila TaxID=419481 RepID=A0A1G5AN64_9BACT|nr:patatin-like phospholipase family protein [Desulfoluna spongiiphila]SCX79329.1 Patatin-like phospholipase [Desulfoluna spongiiphila]VVS90441.1 acyl transferase/acyl hydrolase/lysophospholipase [Desulfoluna spongiiphila]